VLGDRKCRSWELIDWTAGDERCGAAGFAPRDVRHVVLIPNYREPVAVIRRTLDALAVQYRAQERLIIVLGMESREQGSREKGEALAAEYAGAFLDILVTVHPAGLPREVPGKSSNQAWALQVVTERIAEDPEIDPDLVTITSCDADSVLHADYFAALSRLFWETEERHSRFWQAPMQYLNNIWRAPAPVRFSTWFGQAWMRASLAMPFYRGLPISTYSLSLRLAVESGGWDPAVIPEDWHMFLRCFFARDEHVELVPVFLPTNADVPEGETWFAGMKIAFQQYLRHAWGAEDVGYMAGEMARRDTGWRSVLLFMQVYLDHVLRAWGWFLVMSAYLLALGVHPAYEGILAGSVLDVGPQAAWLGPVFGVGAVVMISTLVFEIIRQPLPRDVSRVRLFAEQWLMWLSLPLLGLYLGMLPAIQAQTMLLLGMPLSYRVTPKRIEAPSSS
ncbi:MAG: glycosyltransferase family 2 protein, partial [Coriobacteriia bacterium]|jgi:hypothetical protein|nr:glycosyltransferase family 2 protein [Coriobacteriia bacterium]